MNRRELIEKANLHYTGAVHRCEEGIPIGNGRMGTILWTSPASVKMQVNRVDVYANGNQTNSFIEPHEDYAYACAYVDVDFAGFGEDVFDDTTLQTLNVYDAVASIASHGVRGEAFAAAEFDAFVFRFCDGRKCPEGITVRLRALRNTFVRTRGHVALTDFKRVNDVAIILQQFLEDDYYCASAVAVKVYNRSGRLRIDNERNSDEPSIPRSKCRIQGQENETTLRMLFKPQHGAFDMVVVSAATFDRNDDVIKKVLDELSRVENESYESLKKAHEDWWHVFWEKSYVSLWGNDKAEMASMYYAYFFYIMASCSRNSSFAPNFGGLLFSPRGDRRHWGAMQWWRNLSLTYNAMLPAGREDLMEPYFNMYFNMLDASEVAARQVWGAEGIYIGETSYVWGPEKLPNVMAEEMQDLMLLRKPWEERSKTFKQFASGKNAFEPRWNFLVGKSTVPTWENGQLVYGETPFGPIAFVSHLFGSMAYLAYHYWLAFEYTGDDAFLRDKGYPMIRGVAEFFRTYPNLVKECDGRYHVLCSNHGEAFWGGKDTLDTLTAMHGVLITAINAAKRLDLDAEKVSLWQELLDRLAPLPTSADTECPVPMPNDGSVVWVGARGKARSRENVMALPNPCIYFDMCTLETENVRPDIYRIGRNTLDFMIRAYRSGDGRFFNEMSSSPRIFAAMGEGNLMQDNIIRQLNAESAAKEHCFYEANGSHAIYRNRLTAREGINAISAQRLGNAAASLQLGLLQCSGGAPTLPPVIRVFPAWTKEWNAEFELFARGGFRIAARQVYGVIEYVRIVAQRDNELVFVNPWNGYITAIINDKEEILHGERIFMHMKAGETILFHEK